MYVSIRFAARLGIMLTDGREIFIAHVTTRKSRDPNLPPSVAGRGVWKLHYDDAGAVVNDHVGGLAQMTSQHTPTVVPFHTLAHLIKQALGLASIVLQPTLCHLSRTHTGFEPHPIPVAIATPGLPIEWGVAHRPRPCKQKSNHSQAQCRSVKRILPAGTFSQCSQYCVKQMNNQ